MKSIKCPSLLSAVVFMGLQLAACSSGPQVNELPNTANAVQELNRLQADLDDGRAQQLDVLSPNNFKESQSLYESASKSLDAQKSSTTTLHCISKARAYLDQAKQIAARVDQTIPQVVKGRDLALAVGVRDLYQKDLESTDKRLRGATTDLENGDEQSLVSNRDRLQAEYAALELRAIQQINLGHATTVIEQAIKADAKKFAPQSLAIAQRDRQNAESYITANPHESEEIMAKARIANESADHLLDITHRAKLADKASPEAIALKSESAEAIASDRLVDLNFEKTKNRTLETESKFNSKFVQAQSSFKPDEAEVYRKGDALVIRLRGLDFPTAGAKLSEKSIAVLSKVQSVLKDIDPQTVLIEGHTDSAGGRTVNAKLSTERASIVREYLISNNTAWSDKIKAIGMDYQKPLASNKTSKGRAQNRRVDVVIEPGKPVL